MVSAAVGALTTKAEVPKTADWTTQRARRLAVNFIVAQEGYYVLK